MMELPLFRKPSLPQLISCSAEITQLFPFEIDLPLDLYQKLKEKGVEIYRKDFYKGNQKKLAIHSGEFWLTCSKPIIRDIDNEEIQLAPSCPARCQFKLNRNLHCQFNLQKAVLKEPNQLQILGQFICPSCHYVEKKNRKRIRKLEIPIFLDGVKFEPVHLATIEKSGIIKANRGKDRKSKAKKRYNETNSQGSTAKRFKGNETTSQLITPKKDIDSNEDSEVATVAERLHACAKNESLEENNQEVTLVVALIEKTVSEHALHSECTLDFEANLEDTLGLNSLDLVH